MFSSSAQKQDNKAVSLSIHVTPVLHDWLVGIVANAAVDFNEHVLHELSAWFRTMEMGW